MLGVMLAGHAVGQEMVVFGTDDPGEDRSISLWGADTAWLSDINVRRSVIYMGQPQTDVIRFSFTGDTPISGGALTGSGLTEFNQRMSIVDSYTDSHTALYLNNDTDALDSSYQGSGGVNAATWAELIDATRQACEDAGRTVLSVAPFNEPDYATYQGDVNRLGDVCWELRNTYGANFAGIRLYGASTLNNDQASPWYDAADGWGYLEEGCTHQLAGSFDNYAAFYQTVEANGDFGANDELHNVMEAMVGAEYGMDLGIWWGAAERARGEFVQASDGDRLAFAEHRPNWTAASVYRAPSGAVQAFVGESERQALPTTYRFFSADRPVFYDGHGPQREYSVTTTGAPGYMTADHHNAEKVINITWGDDVQPVIDGRYYVVNRNSHKLMDVYGGEGATGDGANISQWQHTGGLNQQWDINPLPNTAGGDYSYFSIAAAHSGKFPDVVNWSFSDGGDVRQYGTPGSVPGHNQQWYLEYVEDGWFHIRSRWSGKYLEVDGASTADGANIFQWSDSGQFNQQWRLIPVTADPTDFTAPSAPSGVSASANTASVQLDWNANAEGDLEGYTVLRSTTSGGPYDIIARGLTATSYLDSSANQAIPYYYVVQAVDESLNRSANSVQANAAPASGSVLVAEYGFDGSAADATVNANDATLSGGSSYEQGEIGADCLLLDGISGYAEAPTEVANFDQLTVATWVYWGGGAAWQRIFDFGNGTDEYLYLTPANWAGDMMQFTIYQNGVGQDLFASALPVGQWTHVAVTLNGPTVTLYVNGASVASSGSFSIKPSDFNPALNYIGKSQYPDDALFNGALDDFRIYSYALSEPEVASLAALATGNGGSFPYVLSGTSIGTSGSWGNNPATTRDAALDGDLATYFDSDLASGGWVGLDLGSPHVIAEVNFAPRSGWANRMVGGLVQGSDTPDFSSGVVTLHTISTTPQEGVYTSATITDTNAFQYVRYYGPANGYCNIAELAFKGNVASTNNPPAPPAAPSFVGATVVSDTQIDLSWGSSSGATSYNVKRSTTSGGPYATVASPAGTSYSDTGLSASTTYFYVVSAVNTGGESADSSEVSATTQAEPDTTPPAAPAGLGATAGDGSVSLDWADNTEPDLASYTVYRSTTSGSGYASIASGLGSSAYVDNTVANGTTYYYVVTATDTSSNESGSSAEVSATPQAAAQEYVHVDSIVLSVVQAGGPNRRGVATVTIVNASGQPVGGLTVSGDFTGSYNESGSAVTGGSGVAVIQTANKTKNPSFTFTVTNVSGAGYTYDSAANVETSDSY